MLEAPKRETPAGGRTEADGFTTEATEKTDASRVIKVLYLGVFRVSVVQFLFESA